MRPLLVTRAVLFCALGPGACAPPDLRRSATIVRIRVAYARAGVHSVGDAAKSELEVEPIPVVR